MDEATKLFFFFAIVISNLVFLIYWLITMIVEIKNMLLKKFKKVYICLFLCGNKDLYKKKLKAVLLDEENENLREKYIDSLN